jgi:hypothetical protein
VRRVYQTDFSKSGWRKTRGAMKLGLLLALFSISAPHKAMISQWRRRMHDDLEISRDMIDAAMIMRGIGLAGRLDKVSDAATPL